MRLRLGTTIAVALLVGVTATSTAGAGPGVPTDPRAATFKGQTEHFTKLPWRSAAGQVVPGQVVVVWRPGAPAAARQALTARLGTTRAAPPAFGVDVIRLPAGRSMAATISAYRRSPWVRFAEPNRIASIAALPDDTSFDQQWALNNTAQAHFMTNQGNGFGTTTSGTSGDDVDALDAWLTQTGSSSVVIADIDTGVDIGHPDLVNQLVPGYDFVGNDTDPTPANKIDNSHGTHIAGIIAAEQNNTEGITGICPGCRVMPIRIGNATTITLANELKGIDFAIANGANIINLSLGSPIWSKAERAAIAKAGKHGILVVVAAGNASSDNDIEFYAQADNVTHFVSAAAPSYPASYTLKNILAVAATNDRDNYAYFSQCRGVAPVWECAFTNWGHDSVDVAAPGVDILSTVKVGQGQGTGPGTYPDYEFFDGTSMASPLVAGIAGLVLSQNPTYTAVQVKNAIMNSVDHPPTLKLFDAWGDVTKVGTKALIGKFTRTHGRVNAFEALSGSTADATPLTDGNINGARTIKAKRTGSVGWPADVNDVFKKRLVKGSKYHVALSGPKGKDFDLWVWRPGTKEIFQFTAKCFTTNLQGCPSLQAFSAGNGADEAVTFKAPKTGVFYLQVNGWYSGGNYTLTIKKV